MFGDQHCLEEWIKQESSQGKCPMCRQGNMLHSSRDMMTVLTFSLVFKVKSAANEQPQSQQESVTAT